MQARSFPDAEADFDDLVDTAAAALGADPVCSTTNWIVPAASAFAPKSTPRVFRGTHGMVALLEHENPNGPVFTSFDSTWGFATPLIGPDPALLIDEVMADLLPTLDHYAISVSGVAPDGALFDELQRMGPVGYTETADRCVGDLTDGFDAWMGRRSSRFRRSLRAAARRGEAAGVEIEAVQPASGPELNRALERLLAVEATSWKTEARSGLVETDLGFFTRSMSQRFARTGSLRMLFARLDDRDIGYVIGGRHGDRYRGFQHSFDDAFADLSIGKLLQFHNIARLADEGVVAYDMGMHMAYKDSYADRTESTITMIFANQDRRAAVS